MERLAAMAVFAQVVEHKSFSAAATELRLSKSAVSKQIARLEDELGLRLLNRTTRKLALTDAGRTFYEHCARLVAEAEEAERAVVSLQAGPRGVLRVNAPMSFGVQHLAPVIPEFIARYPAVRVDMDFTDRFVDLIDEGYDLAIRIGELVDSSLVARRIAPARRIICASPGYLAKFGIPRHPRELSNHRCLLYSYLVTADEWRFRGAEGSFAVKVDGPFRANNGEALMRAALGDLGLILTPTFMVGRELAEGRLVPVLLDWCDDASALHAVFPHRRHLSATVRAFVDYCAEKFGPEPYWDRALLARDYLPLAASSP